jgi:heme exporter protein C
MFEFANPKRFLDLSGKVLPWLWSVAIGLLIVGLYMALFASPSDYQQGETVKMMYIHVPSAQMAMFCYAFIALSSGVALVWKHPLADMAAKAAAPVGACFTLLALATGSMWGKPMWGTWWVWDARLTSVLILFFLYLGYIALWEAIEDPIKAAKAAAVLALVGAINLPIIKFSVDWWNTLHQPASLVKAGGPAIHPDLLWPLLVMALAYMSLALSLIVLRMRTEILKRRVRSLRMAQARSQR